MCRRISATSVSAMRSRTTCGSSSLASAASVPVGRLDDRPGLVERVPGVLLMMADGQPDSPGGPRGKGPGAFAVCGSFLAQYASSRVLTSSPTPLKTWWVLIILSSCGHASLRLIGRARLRDRAVLRLSRKRNAELPLEMMFQPERAQGLPSAGELRRLPRIGVGKATAAGSPKCPSLAAGTTECHPGLAGESLALPVGLRSIDCDPSTQPLVPWDDETDRCKGPFRRLPPGTIIAFGESGSSAGRSVKVNFGKRNAGRSHRFDFQLLRRQS